MYNRLSKKEALPVSSVMSAVIRQMGLAPHLNRRRVFAAWDEVSGAAGYTESRFFRDGVLYCGIGSSVIRNRLYPHKAELLAKMNEVLEQDELFTKSLCPDGVYVKDIVLR